MRIEVPRHRPASIRLTPLIDVVFILLVFFMLASSFLDWREFDLALPVVGSASEITDRDPVVVAIAGDGTVQVDGEIVAADTLAAHMRPLLADDAQRPVRVRAADAASVQITIQVLDQLGASGAVSVSLEEARE